MAISDLGVIRSATGNETSQTSTAWAVTTGRSAGVLAVLTIAMNNLGTADGQTSQVTSVTDTQSNVWTKAGEYTNTVGGAANDGATISLWFSVLTTALTTSDTITTNYSGALTAKCIYIRALTIGAGNTISVAGSVQVLADDNADAGSMSISGLTSGEYLFWRAIASETDVNGITTASSSYTSITCGNSGTGGSEKGHMAGDLEYRILTGTGSTSDPTMTDTTADRASVFVAFKETVPLSGGVKTIKGLAKASVKTSKGLVIASVKTVKDLTTT